jgi:hypothetical protein
MKRIPTRFLWPLIAAAAFAGLPACGDDDGADADAGADGDADTDADSDTDTTPDGGEVADDSFACWDGVALGEDGASAFTASNDTDGFGITQMQWVDDADAPAYGLYVESWESFGGPTGPGTYPITAAETNYTDCGMCVRLFEITDGTASKEYMPVEGSGFVTIDSLTIGAAGVGTVFAGSFDLQLQEVDVADQGTPVAEGCSGGAKMAWSGEVVDGLPVDVGEPIDNPTFTGFADADMSNLIDTDEEVDVEFSFDSIYADTGKKTLIVVMGAES